MAGNPLDYKIGDVVGYVDRSPGLSPAYEPPRAVNEPPISFAGPEWFAVMTNPKCEWRAAMELSAMGFRTFLPRRKVWVTHARVKKAVERPLLPRYLFVEVDYPRQSFGQVRLVNGVEGILCNSGVPIVIPRRFVEDFLFRYMAGEFDEVAKSALPVGARVRIVEGPYDDVLATVLNVKNNQAVVKLLTSAVSTKLGLFSVRPA